MQICSRCATSAPDDALNCPQCNADLKEWSETAVSLKQLQANPRVSAISIFIQEDCCPTCAQVKGTYKKNRVPALPVQGCSHEHGCRCYYAPILERIFP